ncbi:hypothetical protein H310_01095 [Aphanomyces invadans]|uniref:Uncharacterized protein n=1 Tax=Aphanomyces invadans TaxID=157072 RepID=A0A024USB8_9STRA|nr:hypothetical protein H310_01095 [Aphanomyces invadans]ETW08533.1 hypothetical protein H310_01095 [Aphanomyces invadans]|eukprot:XP_008862338.1 hypothetical protein H310_01095 [Aphanomyces invadans]
MGLRSCQPFMQYDHMTQHFSVDPHCYDSTISTLIPRSYVTTAGYIPRLATWKATPRSLPFLKKRISEFAASKTTPSTSPVLKRVQYGVLSWPSLEHRAPRCTFRNHPN